MSIKKVEKFVQNLPPVLKEQIIGYTRSVQDSLPNIFKEAKIDYDKNIASQVLIIAGIKKLFSICSTQFWTIDNSLNLLKTKGINNITIGSRYINKSSDDYLVLKEMYSELKNFLNKENLDRFIEIRHYQEIIKVLKNGY